MLPSLRKTLLLFISPFAVLILLLASGINAPLILFLYVVIVVEGVGLVLWVLSKIMAEDFAPVLYPGSSKYYFSDRNRAERLFDEVKSASKRPGEYQRYSRIEISRVLSDITGEDSHSPELEFLLNPSKGSKDKFDYLSSLDHVVTELESG